jgi:hypothetical protein
MTVHPHTQVAGRAPAGSRRRLRVIVAVLAAFALVGGGVATALGAAAAVPDYTQGVTSVDATQARFWFKPTTPAALVDVHYLISGQPQQDFRMTNNGGTWEKTIGGLSTGTVVTYWFTYEKGGPLFDTGRFTYRHNGSGGGGGGGGGGGPGTFPMKLVNNTRGSWSNNQIFVLVIGMGTPGQWSYLKPDGTFAHINHLDANAPNHLTKNGRNYPNMSFSLAQASTVTIPNHIEGGRAYISIGSPLFFTVSGDDQGWGGPDVLNPTDPNNDVYWDWYEMAYGFNQFGFGGNTTQVDAFGFPMTVRLQQTSTGYDSTVGITQTRDQVVNGYKASVGPAFQGLVGQYRILAPRTSAAFKPGGAQANYLQAQIDAVWNHYAATGFHEVHDGRTYNGTISGGVLHGTRVDDGAPFTVNKPTSTDVFECSRTMAPGAPASDTDRAVARDFCAAFHRGVAMNTADWDNPAKYYLTKPMDDYAHYFHTISIGGRAYGFAYDDVNDQSSVRILGNANPPSLLTIGIGW